MIQTKDLKKVYITEEIETTALNNINMEIKGGEFVSIMGPSGCGKSTLLNLLGLLDNPSDGEYYFLDGATAGPAAQAEHRFRLSEFQSHRRIDGI